MRLDQAVATGATTAFANTLDDIDAGDEIDLRWLSYSQSVTWSMNGSILSVGDGTTTQTFSLSNFWAVTFTVADDGHGGTLLTASGSAGGGGNGGGGPAGTIELAANEIRIFGANQAEGDTITVSANIVDPAWKAAAASPVLSNFLALYTPDQFAYLVTNGGLSTGGLSIEGHGTVRLTGADTFFGAITVKSGVLIVNGSAPYAPVEVRDDATLGGHGVVGGVTVLAGGTLAPGEGVGTLTTTGVNLAAGATLIQDIGAGAYDQTVVTGYGSVTLSGATLDLVLASDLPTNLGQTFKIIDNRGQFGVSGTFLGLAEGASFSEDGAHYFQISYRGGDGNDVTLTSVAEPGAGGGGTGGTGGGPVNELAAGEIRVFGAGQTADQTTTVSLNLYDQAWTAAASSPVLSSFLTLYTPDQFAYVMANSGFSTGGLSIEGRGTVVLTGANTFFGAITVKSGALMINGSTPYAPIEVRDDATLGGHGVVGTVTVLAGGTLAPGEGVGTLTTTGISLAAGATLIQDIGAGAYDQTVVTGYGTVSLADATLDLVLASDLPTNLGQTFKIIDNRGQFGVSGTFAGLAEGAVTTLGGVALKISYAGGDGNDVVLTALGGPEEILLSHAVVSENARNGTVVGALSALGAAGPNVTYTLLDDDGGRFRIGGANHDRIVVADGLSLDYEQSRTETVRVQVTDGDGHAFEQDLVIRVRNVTPESVAGDARYNRILGGAGADRLFGHGGADALYGGDGADRLDGGAGADVMVGGAGNDRLDGGAGADRLEGGAGNDVYIVDDIGDVVREAVGAGTDTVFSSVTYRLRAGQEIEGLRAYTDAGVTLIGNDVANRILGGAGADRLLGGEGDDTLSGGLGKDVLTGGGGADIFVFSTALGAGNIDTVADFTVGADTIALSRSIFTGLSRGDLSQAGFAEHIVYDARTGALSFDDNGAAPGGLHAFARLSPHLALSHGDFLVV